MGNGEKALTFATTTSKKKCKLMESQRKHRWVLFNMMPYCNLERSCAVLSDMLHLEVKTSGFLSFPLP